MSTVNTKTKNTMRLAANKWEINTKTESKNNMNIVFDSRSQLSIHVAPCSVNDAETSNGHLHETNIVNTTSRQLAHLAMLLWQHLVRVDNTRTTKHRAVTRAYSRLSCTLNPYVECWATKPTMTTIQCQEATTKSNMFFLTRPTMCAHVWNALERRPKPWKGKALRTDIDEST